MKKIIPLLFFVFTSSVCLAQLPDVEVRDLDWNWISLSEFKGEKFTVVECLRPIGGN